MTAMARRRPARLASATLAMPAISLAAGRTEISFHLPVAFGGPIAEIIDNYALAQGAARWGIDNGHVGTRPDAWATSAMRKYIADFPSAAVARDRLQYAVAELSAHDNQRLTQTLNNALQVALLSRQTPDAALASDAQATSNKTVTTVPKLNKQ